MATIRLVGPAVGAAGQTSSTTCWPLSAGAEPVPASAEEEAGVAGAAAAAAG